MRENNNQATSLGTTERTISILGGSYLLYSAMSNEGKSFPKAVTAGYLLFRGATGNCPISNSFGESEVDQVGDINIKTSLKVDKPRQEVYEFWRELENLPLFMDHLKRVTVLDEKTSHWEAKMPDKMGAAVSWKSEITEDEKGRLLGWQSLPNSTIENLGNVSFRDAEGGGTEIDVIISYKAPMGKAGEDIAKLFNPMFEGMVKEDVEGFKHFMETGEMKANT